MREGSGRGSGRVGSDILTAIAGRVGSGRVGSGRVNVSPGRVGSKKSDPWTTLIPQSVPINCSMLMFYSVSFSERPLGLCKYELFNS